MKFRSSQHTECPTRCSTTVPLRPNVACQSLLLVPVGPPIYPACWPQPPPYRSSGSLYSSKPSTAWTRCCRSFKCLPVCRLPPCRRSEEHTSELQSRFELVCRLLLEKKKQAASRR